MEKKTYYQLNRDRINTMNKERYHRNKKPEYIPTDAENEEQFRRIRDHVKYIRELREQNEKKEQVKKTYVYY